MAHNGGSTAGPPNTMAAAAVPSAPAAAVAAGPPWWSSFNQQLASTRQHLARVATDLQVASKSWKAPDLSKGLGVKLDIDMLSPAVSTVKQQYQALPEPVRDVMPFAGVAAATSLAVSKLYDHQLRQAQQRYGLLQQDHEQLQHSWRGSCRTLMHAGPMPTWRSRWRRQLPKPQQQQQPQPPQPHQQPPQQLQRLQLQRLYLRKTATAGHDMTEALQEQRVPMMSWFSWLPPVATVSALGFWCWMGECTTAATAQGATCG